MSVTPLTASTLPERLTVWLLIHDDREYDMGDTYVVGVYLTKALAEDKIVSRTPSGAKSRAWRAHDDLCCGVTDAGA